MIDVASRIRPSSLPALMVSPCWVPSGIDPDGYMASGTQRHAALTERLTGADVGQTDAMDEDDRAAVQWASDYIIANAPRHDHPVHCERRMTLLDDGFREILSGTPDVVCGNHLFDLKWRRDDYGAQMLAYAAMMFQEGDWAVVHVHVLYGAQHQVQRYDVDPTCIDQVRKIVEEATGFLSLAPGRYCNRCARVLTCPAIQEHVEALAHGYAESPKLQQWHPSKMETAEDLAAALELCRKVIQPWVDSVNYHAHEAVVKRGLALPGFVLKTKNGRKSCTNVQAAFAASGLPQDQFLAACKVSLNTSKRDPSMIGLVDRYAKFSGLPKAHARRELLRKLEAANALQTGKPGFKLVSTGEDTTTTEEED